MAAAPTTRAERETSSITNLVALPPGREGQSDGKRVKIALIGAVPGATTLNISIPGILGKAAGRHPGGRSARLISINGGGRILS